MAKSEYDSPEKGLSLNPTKDRIPPRPQYDPLDAQPRFPIHVELDLSVRLAHLVKLDPLSHGDPSAGRKVEGTSADRVPVLGVAFA